MSGAATQQVENDLGQIVELFRELPVSVDEQHDLRQVHGWILECGAQRGQGIGAMLLEEQFPLVQQATNLLQGTAHHLTVGADCHPTHVDQVTQAQQGRTEQVQHVDADERRGVRQGQ